MLDEALALAEMMLDCSPVSLKVTKQIFREGGSSPDLKTAVTKKYEAVSTLLSSEDFIEGPRAFAEKRKPTWSGK